MSIRTGSRPKWLYWPKAGPWQFHISWIRLHIAFAAGTKSRRWTDDYASYTSRQRSAADDLALAGFARLSFAKRAAFASAESAAFALGSAALGGFVLGSPSVA